MPIARTSIIRGPAVVQFDSTSFFSKGDIELDLGLETMDIETSAHGKVDERVTERVSKVRFTPAGEFENLSVLWPYGATVIGTSIFGATDKPLVIHTLAGKTLTFAAAAVTKMPNLILSATKTLIGDVEFTCLGTDNEAWTETDNLVAVASASYSDATFDPASILTQPYSAAWGATSPWDAINTFDGWSVEFDLGLEPVRTDSDGTIDMTFSALGVSASCQPVGITEQQAIDALKLQGAGNYRGRSLQANSNDLVISGTGVVVTVKKAQLKTAPMGFGPRTPRVGTLMWTATRPFSLGVAGALFTVATS